MSCSCSLMKSLFRCELLVTVEEKNGQEDGKFLSYSSQGQEQLLEARWPSCWDR